MRPPSFPPLSSLSLPLPLLTTDPRHLTHHSSIKLGSTTQLTAAELLSNLRAVLPHIATRIPQAPSTFSNVQSLHLKSSTSVALPIYNAALSTRFDPVEEGDEVRAARDLAQRRKEEERRRREEREAEKERRRLERAATREGKGRAEKREREDEDGEGAEAGGEEAPVAEAAPPAAEEDKVDEAPKPKAKKAKKESTTSPAATKEDKKAAKPKKAAAAKKAKA